MTSILRLPSSAYESSSVTVAFLLNVGWIGLVAIIIFIAGLLMTGAPALQWNQLDGGEQIQWFVLFLAALIAWFISTLGHNAHFNQSYTLDKIAVPGLFLLLLWRPVFILPFLLLVFLLFWQLAQPAINSGSHFAHKLQVLHVLNLFAAWLLLHAIGGRQRSTDLLMMVACLVASAYWVPAFKKLMIGWLYSGEIFTMPLNAHAHGWLSFLDASVIVKASSAIAGLDWPLRLFVFAIEAGCLFFLWRRWYALTLLACLMLFHLGVFVLFGYLFWTWILLNGALFLLLLRQEKNQTSKLFTPVYFVLAIGLIFTAKLWCSPASLAWIDGRLSYTYRYEAIGDSGARYQLPFRYFEPYGDVFTMANFSYLVDEHNMLVNPYGSTNRKQAIALESARTLDDVEALEDAIGWRSHDAERSDRFADFIVQFVKNTNANNKSDHFRFLRPPRQFWTQPRGNVYTEQEPISAITVSEVTTLFDGSQLSEIREIEVLKVAIE